jgi:DNA (cytosine-5)-methyltransferase 1
MRLGVEHAGITTVWANDFDKNACRAHEHNFGAGSIVQGDITQIPINSIPDADFVIGGPPCQDYSTAGKGAGEAGERGKLVWRYLEIIAAKRPKAFLFENVKGLTTRKHRHTLDALVAEFEALGYRVTWRVLNAWDYGVAQKRERVFIVGIREDLGFEFEWPSSEFEMSGYRPVLRDAIGDLPEPTENERNPQDGRYSSQYLSRNRVVPWDDAAYTVLTNARDASIHPADGSVTMDKVRASIANPVIGDYWTPKSEYSYDQANRIQSMDAPCNTIPAHHNSGQPIHPTSAPRRFTVRECLRIQSVPDTYVFPEGMSLSAMYRVVGNGVASRVAYHLAAALSAQVLAAQSSNRNELSAA